YLHAVYDLFCYCIFLSVCFFFFVFFFIWIRPTPCFTLFPYTTLFRSVLSFSALLINVAVQRCPFPRFSKATAFFNKSLCESKSRSEEHTSELQSRFDLVCRLLLEKKKNNLKS